LVLVSVWLRSHSSFVALAAAFSADVEHMDAEICKVVESNPTLVDAGRVQ